MKTYKIASTDVFFPQGKRPFPQQFALMGKLLSALNCSENALLESPTGTGKTLALLSGVLSWQKYRYEEDVRLRAVLEEEEDALNQTLEEEKRKMREEEKRKEEERVQQKARSKYFMADNGSGDGNGEQGGPSFESDDDDDFCLLGPAKSNLTTAKRPVSKENEHPNMAKSAKPPKKVKRHRIKRETIFFASRTHSQISQLIQELKSCPEEVKRDVEMAVLASRNHYCINSQIVRSKKKFASASAKNEACRKRIGPGGVGCKYLVKKGANTKMVSDCSSKVWDIEDLVTMGKSSGSCPYFTAQQIAKEHANLIFCPYNYLLDPLVRQSMGIDAILDGSIIVIDEAHNVEGVCRDAASFETKLGVVSKMAANLDELASNGPDEKRLAYELLASIIKKLDDWIVVQQDGFGLGKERIYTGAEALVIFETHLGLTEETICEMRAQFTQASKLDKENEEFSFPSSVRQFVDALLVAIEFMVADGKRFAGDFSVVVRQSKKEDVEFCIWCLNPAVAFRSLAERCRSVILTSGTLSPINSFAWELGVPFKHCLEASHVINVKEQLWAGVVSTEIVAHRKVRLEATYQTKNASVFKDAIANSLKRFLHVIPHGSLAFFPSYSLMKACVERWKETGAWDSLIKEKPLILVEGDAQNSLDEQFASFRSQVEGDKKGALFLCVFRGKLSEGIDFADEAARGVFIIGIPYPSFADLNVQLKRKYQDKVKLSAGSSALSGREWYSQQAFRALNQAIGRCIRHKKDYGAIIFLDYRFTQIANQNCLSKWVRGSIVHLKHLDPAVESLASFFLRNSGKSMVSTPENTAACQNPTVEKVAEKASVSQKITAKLGSLADIFTTTKTLLSSVSDSKDSRPQVIDKNRCDSLIEAVVLNFDKCLSSCANEEEKRYVAGRIRDHVSKSV
uniref:Regulator of telomere elongation helicase 1 homolog n=1 Tax=Mucochytrium quahogii TaxID=96639 RepID=A0A7S2RVG0_9STRA|mmetsp:Transcript_36022/g.57681  ORF Transcript_36022/g.57681 Transcript_36022/m.57681 type:complete len:910 (-) Transcript_36022:1633-4362(-)